MGAKCSRSSVATAPPVFVVQEAGASIPVRPGRKMGWKKDLPDFRDRMFALPIEKKQDFPCKVDLRPAEHFGIYDQGKLGSCTANALGAAFHFDQVKEGKIDFVPSRLFIYYNERSMEGCVDQDAGSYLRDGIKSLNQIGVCSEKPWEYDESQFTVRPTEGCYTSATANRASEYARIPQTIEDIKGVLKEGFPFVFGFVVLSSFRTEAVSSTGYMTMPQPEDSTLGGHAVMAIGYDDEKQVVIVRNSWGEGWGDAGYFYMPYDYICHPFLAGDMWAIKSVDGKDFPTTTRKI
mmetsp:Transcript_83413/g.268888  ORF Transcript_83413/g.268888 Transcript_83413/m.268888 type:complete len:292 (-) Transcript_83413:281-1156(-)